MTPGPHLWSSMTQRSGRRAAMDFISLLVAKTTSEEARRPPVSELRTIVRGRLFLESPRWRDGALWVADWGAHEALKIGPGGAVEVVARTSSFPMCLEHLPDGRLIIVDSAARRLARVEPDGTLVTHADLSAL